jgi:hypothetical protein
MGAAAILKAIRANDPRRLLSDRIGFCFARLQIPAKYDLIAAAAFIRRPTTGKATP